ncbi:hypothetical protein VNO77_17741 [Canavalia gladiata]|uniref:Uncharacterized protein n=1 Tax=Canavalia gladiata TaxID=3824 RepID=A0AAN9LMX4_CANGL
MVHGKAIHRSISSAASSLPSMDQTILRQRFCVMEADELKDKDKCDVSLPILLLFNLSSTVLKMYTTKVPEPRQLKPNNKGSLIDEEKREGA